MHLHTSNIIGDKNNKHFSVGIATRKLKVQNVSYTVEIPCQNKLQLKVISVQDINYKQTAMQLYDMLFMH